MINTKKIYLENRNIYIILILVLSIIFNLIIFKHLYSEGNLLWMISAIVLAIFTQELLEYIMFLIPDLILNILIIICIGVIIISTYALINFELSFLIHKISIDL